jgi:hypothetical protein
VYGNLNLTGLLKLNGEMGTAGQVLTSNGGSNPQWKEAAYSNTTRFSTTFSRLVDAGSVNFVSQYNTNPTDITIGANTITINKSGLYHFEGVAGNNVRFASVQTKMPTFYFIFEIGTTDYIMVTAKQMLSTYGTQENYGTSERFSIDLFVVAPKVISLSYIILYNTPALIFDCSGWFNGNLISD